MGEGTYYTDALQWSVDQGITGLDGACFSPDSAVTRGETAQIIWNMKAQPSAEPHPFTDVTVKSQNPAVSWIIGTSIMSGTSDTTFAPGQTLTRAELAALLYRLAGEPEAGPHPFTDVVEDWQQAPVLVDGRQRDHNRNHTHHIRARQHLDACTRDHSCTATKANSGNGRPPNPDV